MPDQKATSDVLTSSNDLDIEPDPDESESPFYDGGYGWVIVGACFLGQIMFPICYSFGLFNIALLEYYGKTKAETALVGSLCYTFTAGSGLLASLLSNWLSHRVTVILGSLLTASGYLISAFSSSLPVLYFTYGVIIGTGVSLQTVPTNVMVNFYFDKRRNLATGIMASGSGLGSLILPLLIQFFIDKYTWRGAMIMLAGVSLHGCIAGALLRPNEKLKRLQTKTSQKVKVFDCTLLKKWSFFVILLVFAAEGMQTLTFFTMFPHRILEYDFTQDQAAVLLFLVGIGSTLSRVVAGALMHFFNIDLSVAFGTVVAGMGLANLAVSFQHTQFWSLALIATFFGAMLGVMAYLFPLYVYDLFGIRRVTSAFGCVVMGEAVGGFIGPALAGYIYDRTGDYQIPFSIAFGSAVCSALLNTPLYLYRRRRRKELGNFTIT
ncbi:monocarboxylate transporter 12-like [Lineus longissimus]|uniref:monocarboxylate transporter 12-like n=1 Tax=Lineus longissimus TaxID=88925 RepID=UPI00315D1181